MRSLQAAFDAALGTASDPAIAERFGVLPETVRTRRVTLGIPAWRAATKGDPIEALLAQGGLSDSEIARRVGVTPKAVRKRRLARGTTSPYTDSAQDKIERVTAYLAANPHASIREIAAATGVSKSVVGVTVKQLRSA